VGFATCVFWTLSLALLCVDGQRESIHETTNYM
jgi:hypothetical protein